VRALKYAFASSTLPPYFSHNISSNYKLEIKISINEHHSRLVPLKKKKGLLS
jgi:hypothetical protein